MEDLARDHISVARQLASNGSFCKAFDLYILGFDKNPQLKRAYEVEFRHVLTNLINVLVVVGKIEDIFYHFGRAIKAFPEDPIMLNDIGKYFFKYGFYTEAWDHFQKALNVDSGFVNAEKNLNSVKNVLVERWHFRMLNDKIRNEAYHAAMKETIIPHKDSVLDIGTGTGLLSLYATESHPIVTTGCDGSEIMCKIAQCVLEDNGKTEVIIINKMSTDMTYKEAGGKRTILVTEMFDAGLFGEHIMQTLCHARVNFMTAKAKVIPNKAEFFVAGANCNSLYLKYQLSTAVKKLLNITNTYVVIVPYDNDPYDSEDVHSYKDLKYMTEPQSVLKVDFNDHSDMSGKLKRTAPYVVPLKGKEKGEITIIIGWFNLYITDKITLTTDPRADNRSDAWQQAVFYDIVPQDIEENQVVKTQFLLNGGKITIVPNYTNRVLRASSEMIRFLNDTDFINMITKCIGMASVYLGQLASMSHINIVDLCPFPYFGFLMMKRGAQSLTCWAKSDHDRKFIKKVFKVNKIPITRVKILRGENWDQDSFRNEKYHAVFTNVFELCGDMDLHLKEIARHLKYSHLLPGGLFMPYGINMMGQIVNCPWLDINNRVYDANVSNYKIAMHMNKFQVSQNFYLDLTRLEYTALSEPVLLCRCRSGMESEVINVPIIKTGYANAILFWFDIELMQDLGEITTRRSNSFIDNMAFLANPQLLMARGQVANILRCMDPDGSFKLMIDVEGT